MAIKVMRSFRFGVDLERKKEITWNQLICERKEVFSIELPESM